MTCDEPLLGGARCPAVPELARRTRLHVWVKAVHGSNILDRGMPRLMSHTSDGWGPSRLFNEIGVSAMFKR